jgi:Family of unknown function (DUF6662)
MGFLDANLLQLESQEDKLARPRSRRMLLTIPGGGVLSHFPGTTWQGPAPTANLFAKGRGDRESTTQWADDCKYHTVAGPAIQERGPWMADCTDLHDGRSTPHNAQRTVRRDRRSQTAFSGRRKRTERTGQRIGGSLLIAGLLLASLPLPVHADEQLLNYVKGAEVQPKGTWQLYQWITQRRNKGTGHYTGSDYRTELEYGFTDRLAGSLYVNGQGINTQGIRVDAYIPKDESYAYRLAGMAAAVKYNFVSPIINPIGVSLYAESTIGTKDPHSGQDKRTYSFETLLLLQKNFRGDTVIWMTNVGLESTYAKRAAVSDLPPDFEWPVVPEMEIEPTIETGISGRIASNLYVGAEVQYQTEFETDVGQERWSLFAGPTVHYGARKWWATFTWFPQLRGGGEIVSGQSDTHLHLVEKTKQEWRFKVAYNF